MRRAGLVLTSGGARGAYQAGVLRALAEYLPSSEGNPFPIVAGVSAGSINAGFLATEASDFRRATEGLYQLWKELHPDSIFHTDAITLSRIGAAWLTDLSLGGLIGSGRGRSLLNTEPLRRFLTRWVDCERIQKNLDAGVLRGLAVTATNYHSGSAVTFYEGAADIEPWIRSTRIGVRDRLTIEHLMASSAIPVFFPAVCLNDAYYGDGAVRLTAPLSPAIHLGADRVLAIGIRHRRSPATTVSLNRVSRDQYPQLADIAGVLLNALFLDGLESDLERMLRINQTLQLIPPADLERHPGKLRQIPVLAIRPSADLGALVLENIDRFPRTVRHLLRGLGASRERGWDLLSYLAFDTSYTTRLLELGYQDGLEARDEVLAFWHAS